MHGFMLLMFLFIIKPKWRTLWEKLANLSCRVSYVFYRKEMQDFAEEKSYKHKYFRKYT